jgi:hypothetical protein
MENKNHILEAYNAGKRIKHEIWTNSWIKKHSENETIDDNDVIKPYSYWKFFNEKLDEWRVHPDDIEPEETQTEIQKAIDLLKANGYEIYQFTKTKL